MAWEPEIVVVASIFQRGKKKIWWIKYYVHGKQVYHSLDTVEERVALRFKRHIEGEHAKGGLLAPSKTPLPSFLQDYCQFLVTIRTAKSYKNDVSVLRVFFGPICPALKLGTCVNTKWRSGQALEVADRMKEVHVHAQYLEEITPGLLEDFLARRCREEKIAPKTANRCREVLHRMFNYATKSWGFVSPDRRHSNPAAQVERRKEPARTIRYLGTAQIDAQLNVLKDKIVLRASVAMMIYAGLRREETLWLTENDVDLERRLIHVRAKTVDGVFWQPKTKRNRVVPISDALFVILSTYALQRSGKWFFPSSTGKRWDPDNYSQDLRAINEPAGLVWSCLDFRHTFGSHLAQKGESLFKIATLMGNSPEICRRHYAALIPEEMHDVVEFERSDVTEGQRQSTNDLLKQLLEKLNVAPTGDRANPLRLAQ